MAMRQPIPSSSYASVTSSGIQSAGSSSSGNNNNNMTSSSAVLSSELDFYDLFNPPTEKSAKMQLEYAKSNIFGLLEVEPLHFTCHSTSDGTKMERYDNSSVTGGHGGTVNPAGISGTINFGEGIPVQPSSMASASANTSTLANLSSSMSVTKQQLQELSSKTYPTIKHKIMHIKQILSEVGKSLPQESMAKYTSEQLFPPTPKTTPQVMTPSFTPPNEVWQQVILFFGFCFCFLFVCLSVCINLSQCLCFKPGFVGTVNCKTFAFILFLFEFTRVITHKYLTSWYILFNIIHLHLN